MRFVQFLAITTDLFKFQGYIFSQQKQFKIYSKQD